MRVKVPPVSYPRFLDHETTTHPADADGLATAGKEGSGDRGEGRRVKVSVDVERHVGRPVCLLPDGQGHVRAAAGREARHRVVDAPVVGTLNAVPAVECQLASVEEDARPAVEDLGARVIVADVEQRLMEAGGT
jgi:hypothetical protein